MSSRKPQPPSTTTYRPPRQVQRGATTPAPRRSWTTPKRMIWTGAFAAVTMVGTIYGAGLKTQQDYHILANSPSTKKEKKQILETPIEERISALEARRAQLMTQKRPFERKLEELRLRVQKQDESSQTTNSRS
ncbi:hypothetical protein E0Z10_g10312 [Xylaria hypoxylon]|uniref:Cytochrome c oxidase assembly factor 3 n=1 Tax=Xylaria hypoxylon TaxID=37992 RepID=A0A4Z0Y3A2_9PEZI|nr:hypothetical protein E0Z10_g10312 [Xylaria hypoxylon]